MLQSVYAVYDTKAKAYLQPFHAVNGAVASRMIADAVSQPGHMFAVHSADFVLFEIAKFDDESGLFESTPSVNLGNLLTFKEPSNG